MTIKVVGDGQGAQRTITCVDCGDVWRGRPGRIVAYVCCDCTNPNAAPLDDVGNDSGDSQKNEVRK